MMNRKPVLLFALLLSLHSIRCAGVQVEGSEKVHFSQGAVEEFNLQLDIVNKLNKKYGFTFKVDKANMETVVYLSSEFDSSGNRLPRYVLYFFADRRDASTLYSSLKDSDLPVFKYGGIVVICSDGDYFNIAQKLATVLKGMGFKIE